MRNIASTLVVDKNKLASDRAWLFCLNIRVKDPVTNGLVETIRLVRNDESVVINGETYNPFPFSVDIQEENGIPRIQLVMEDQTQTVQAKMEQYAGGVGFEVDVIVTSVDDSSQYVSEPEFLEAFLVTEGTYSNYVASWTLSVPNPLSVMFPRRKQYSDQCSFAYKSTECGYSGPIATCDLTLSGANGCAAHSNQRRYGGMPGVKIRGT